ncbi:uncharacterized protein MYCFIDRAFT_178183 [Pseudocercospora fijiensis CIRAD86]|uniref:Uncharacterized protein n=1 Tax=Pseudocercospora fijiensis (strain CIRAD86) TaxID=383855 RepID=M2ZKI9_PSEFD|nr:uncharacterized protein MYCFIDRAFT_178183 [Pseudocercospora fijiensis CIRAD86]EME79599.1 hypothetical protein MYCFIDRAFT_178183 [Pseudocercospora fijiensis CIRAD86]
MSSLTPMAKNIPQGAATQVWAATAKHFSAKAGCCVADCGESTPWREGDAVASPGYATHAYDEAKEERLCKLSCDALLLGTYSLSKRVFTPVSAQSERSWPISLKIPSLFKTLSQTRRFQTITISSRGKLTDIVLLALNLPGERDRRIQYVVNCWYLWNRLGTYMVAVANQGNGSDMAWLFSFGMDPHILEIQSLSWHLYRAPAARPSPNYVLRGAQGLSTNP